MPQSIDDPFDEDQLWETFAVNSDFIKGGVVQVIVLLSFLNCITTIICRVFGVIWLSIRLNIPGITSTQINTRAECKKWLLALVPIVLNELVNLLHVNLNFATFLGGFCWLVFSPIKFIFFLSFSLFVEIEASIPHDWQGGHCNVVKLIHYLFIKGLSWKCREESEIELSHNIQEILIESVEDHVWISSIGLTTVEE